MDKYTEMLVFSKAADLGQLLGSRARAGPDPLGGQQADHPARGPAGRTAVPAHHRKLSLTAEGNAFNERCGSILDEIRQAEDAVMALHDRVSGTLRITTISAFARIHMVKLMPEFMAQHPELRVELELSERQVDLVGEGVDAALSWCPTD